MPVIEDFADRPVADTEAGDDAFAVERDLLAMPDQPWRAWLTSVLAVALLFCIAHGTLLATKEKNKLIGQTLAMRADQIKMTASGLTIGDDNEVVLVPAGKFFMGREEDDEETNSDTTPMHEVYLPDFYIGKYEVTNAQYAKFVQETNHIPPVHWKGETHPPEGLEQMPVQYVSWYNARAYADWAGGRLCTEQEWEKAARGTDKRLYPYGNELDPKRANIDYQVQVVTPVGSYPEGVSPYGVHDMMGNVYEWTADRYRPYPGNQDDPIRYAAYKTDEEGNVMIDPDRESFYVVARGGCFKCDPWSSQVTTRNNTRPDFASDFFGIRVCWDKPGTRTARIHTAETQP